MASFDEHLNQQLNQRDADEEFARKERNAKNYRQMESELQRLQTLISDLPYAKNLLEQSEMIAESAKIIASHAEAIQ